jgi:hypothetical protein
MTITQMRVTCQCGHTWDAETVTNAPASVWIAATQAIRCPKCGNGHDKITMGGSYPESELSAAASEMDRAEWWRRRGDVGESSLTIWCTFMGRSIGGDGDYNPPHDPDDFRRCKKLLDLLPEWRRDLARVSARFRWMTPFVERWDEFDKLWAEESPKGSCPKLYELMDVAGREAEAIRYPSAV